MPSSASASGADAGSGGAASSRAHNQGNQDRKYTSDQAAAVLRVRKCSPTAFYEILNLESVRTTVTDTEIKKAYRKLSLLTHPDKNGHPHADEAFKMVSRAFGVLGDADKRKKYDTFGGDPDSRFGGGGGGGPAANPFAGFAARNAGARAGGAGGRPAWDDEISPEEMFNRFFGGGMGGGFGPFGGGMFDTGPQFVFNLGGGPGIRVHQFGGARPRRRPREAAQPEGASSLLSTIIGLLPLLVLFILPLMTSLFSGNEPKTPSMRFDAAVPPHSLHRTTPTYKISYWLNPADVAEYTGNKFAQLDQRAEYGYIKQLKAQCEHELDVRQRRVNDAHGWLFVDAQKMQEARDMELPGCSRMEELRIPRNSY